MARKRIPPKSVRDARKAKAKKAAAAAKKKTGEPAWYLRLKRTVKFKARLEEIMEGWPTDGSDCTDQEADVDDAYKAWHRDICDLPEVE